MHKRSGFTLIESIIVTAVIGVLVAITVPAIQQGRTRAREIECVVKLKNVGLAATNYDSGGRILPGVERIANASHESYGIGWFYILPFLEQRPLYDSALTTNGVYDISLIRHKEIKALRCWFDDTDQGTGVVKDDLGSTYGASSVGINGLLLAVVDTGPDPRVIRPTRDPSDTISKLLHIEGQSNTILVTEKVAVCGSDTLQGGSAWAYHELSDFAVPLYAVIGLPWGPNNGIGPNTTFQALKKWDAECNPLLASTRHQAGIPVCWADGHVSIVNLNIAAGVWWACMTIDGGEVVNLE